MAKTSKRETAPRLEADRQDRGSKRRKETSRPKTVLVFGVFDLLHPGHVFFLEQARSHGERLVVIVTRDERALEGKGRRPVFSLEERLKLVGSLQAVDLAEAGDRPGEWTAILRHKPNVICIGHDQTADHPKIRQQIESITPKPQILRLPTYGDGELSSSAIRRRLLDETAGSE
ncbi:MAG: adenylyltransferase/cytidyltransferase family protein [bacterium]